MRTCKVGNSFRAANEQFTVRKERTNRGATDENGSAWHAQQVLDYLSNREVQSDSKPFLIYFGFSHPHDPRMGNSELLKNYRISLKQDFEYNQNNDLSRSNFQAYIQVLTILNTDILYNYEYNFVKTHLDAKFEDFTNHWIRMSSQPTSFLNFSLFYTWGPDISYRDLALGERENVNFLFTT